MCIAIIRSATIYGIIFVFLQLLSLVAMISSADSEERFALLVGNSRYEFGEPLRNPENDIKLMADSLTAAGFQVTTKDNLRLSDMRKEITDFISLVSKSENPTILIYYAGHGAQIDGDNYILPIDAKVDDQDKLKSSSISINDLTYHLSSVSSNLQMIVLDACRDDPFRFQGRGLSRGLAKVYESKGRLIAFSTAPGSVALDGTTGTSPYASALAETILLPGLSLEETFKHVRQLVKERTGGRQETWENASLSGTFYFLPGQGPSALPTAEQDFWDLASVIDTAEGYQKYLTRFPQGRFAALARQKIDAVNKDFSFRRQSETFPVLIASESAVRTNYECGDTDERRSKSKFIIRNFEKFNGQIIYVDITLNIAKLLCDNESEINQLKNFDQSNDPCAGTGIFTLGGAPSYQPIYTFGDISSDPPAKCKTLDDLYLKERVDLYLKKYGNAFFSVGGGGDFKFMAPIVDSSYFQSGDRDTEGQPEDSEYHFRGLVRVSYEAVEATAAVALYPVDPAELGMSAKYQNTVEAVKNHSFVKDMDIAALAAAENDQTDMSYRAQSRPDILEAEKAASGLGVEVSSFWLHNGSLVGLQRNGSKRTLIYLRPKDGLDAIGIKAGIVLFDGNSPDGVRYEGVSQVFLKPCGSTKFPVHGKLSEDNHSISLSGTAPRSAADCRQIGATQIVLNFDFLGTTAGVTLAEIILKQFPSGSTVSSASASSFPVVPSPGVSPSTSENANPVQTFVLPASQYWTKSQYDKFLESKNLRNLDVENEILGRIMIDCGTLVKFDYLKERLSDMQDFYNKYSANMNFATNEGFSEFRLKGDDIYVNKIRAKVVNPKTRSTTCKFYETRIMDIYQLVVNAASYASTSQKQNAGNGN